MRGENLPPQLQENRQAPTKAQTAQGALGDNQIANNLRQQAQKMAAEAKGLMAESERLLKEAAQLDPVPLAKAVPALEINPVAKRRGRPAKVKVTA
jgi:hypothetical protein